ncbi:hypothetical protein Clacol_008367 [Clathrus columnatus]|uniref:Peptidase A1 domain-containing protein n=1 Tax=Clathrus columnatus TaxID=1419009 RepID=A0AAV5AQD7_9AGAM|nr:hypothetical protein Clacol_008367 [Clathrus columnatus]
MDTTCLPMVKNHASRCPRSGSASYARAARRYNFDSPIFVGYNGTVFRRYESDDYCHMQTYRGHQFDQDRHGSNQWDDVDYDNPDIFHPDRSGVTEVAAEDIQHDQEYVVPVLIGSPGVVLHLDLDTGSSDLWVWSSELRIDTQRHNIYIPEESATARELVGATWRISYGDGSSASGNVYTDNVTIGNIRIPNQAVELAEDLSQSFIDDVGSDGLLGLAWPSLNTVRPYPVRTPIQNMLEQGRAPGIFSVALDKGDGNGFYTFGGIDPFRAGVYESDIIYTTVDNSKGFWMFYSESARINGQTFDLPENKAIMDTGTSLTLLSDDIVRATYSTIPGAYLDEDHGGWVYPGEEEGDPYL